MTTPESAAWQRALAEQIKEAAEIVDSVVLNAPPQQGGPSLSAARRKPPIPVWTVLYNEDADGTSMVLPDDFAGDEADALLELLVQAYGGPKFSRDNPVIQDALPDVRVGVWHSCTKAWCEAEGVDGDGYKSGWFAPNGDGARWINVVWYRDDFYDLGDEAAKAEGVSV